jgi:CHAT domain-containing protein/Tfp pilus assembly protein PilF
MFVWSAAVGARSYRFMLSDPADLSGGKIFERDVPEPRLIYPTDAPPLEPGRLYEWQVSTPGILERRTGPWVTFFVLAGEDADQIRTELKKARLLEPATAADRLKQARIFAQFGVWYDALRIASELITGDPGDVEAMRFYKELTERLAAEQQAAQPEIQQAKSRPAKNEQDARALAPGEVVEREITGGQVHRYWIKVNPGQFLHVVVDQRGVDVAVALIGLDRHLIVKVDSPDLSRGPERVSLVASDSGLFEIQVHPVKEEATAGRYQIKIAELREVRPQDAKRVTAEKLFSEGEAFRLQWTADGFRRALEKYQASLDLWAALNDLRGEGATLNLIGMTYSHLGERQKQLEYLNRAVSVRHAAGDLPGEAQSLNNLGVGYAAMGETAKALEYFHRSLQLEREVGDRTVEAFLLSNIGWIYLNTGQIQTGLEYFTQALKIDRAIGDLRSEAYTRNTIGSAYASLGEYQEAIEQFTEALRLWRLLGIRREEVSTLNAIAGIYVGTGHSDKALEYLNQAVPLFEFIADKSVRADTLSALAWIAASFHEYQKALETYHVALSTYQQVHARAGEGYTLASIGTVYFSMGEYQKAISYYNRSLVITREIKDRSSEGSILSFMMYACKALHQTRQAIFYGKQSINTFQEIRTNIKDLEKNLQKSFLGVRSYPYRELANLLISEGRLTEAQGVLGLLKEEEYFQFVRRSSDEASSLKGRADLTPAELEIERNYLEIADRVTALGKERSELVEKRSLSADEEQRLKKLDADLELASQAFQKFLDQLSDEFAKTKQGSEKVFELRESQGMMADLRDLGADSVVLYTIVGEDKYRVVLITPDVQVAREYNIKAGDLFKKVLAFREAIQDRTADPRPLAQDLYQILVGPVETDLKNAKAGTLMWSLDGVLRYVPIAALFDGRQYLVERYRNVVYTPASQARLKDLPSLTWKGLGLGVSKAQTGFKALPAVPAELHGIIREQGSDATAEGVLPGSVMLDEAFTEDSMKQALRQKYSLVHIASHFQILPGNETSSFLLLGDGTHLTLDRIKSSVNLFGGVEMLTLSACDTATGGTNENGKEVEGFAVLAQRQGAKAVLATLWAVADESTGLLMQDFYRRREAQPGILKAEALRQAQLTLLCGSYKSGCHATNQRAIRSGSGEKQPLSADPSTPYAHPYFWAPFVLIGNWK